MPGGEPPARYTVTSLTDAVKNALETRFPRLAVEGEISGWRVYPSGHAYFTLKDGGAQLSAVMFAGRLSRCPAAASLKDGAKVIIGGALSVYPPRGNYQLVAHSAKLVGEGELMRRYLELKRKLGEEGLFDPAAKRPLPDLPRRIGIVTSEAGAVIHDMCRVFSRRFPALEIRLYPCQVQGAEAPRSIIDGLRFFNTPSDWTADLVIVARGGGSFEDLFCFNDEALVRAVAASRIPVVSAVGHETDYTLCDFAADVRAGTPSIAAEITVPVMADLLARLRELGASLANSLRSRGEFFAQRTDQLASALSSSLTVALANAARRLDAFRPRLSHVVDLRFQREAARLATASAKLTAYSPYGVLERGYSLTTAPDGSVVTDAAGLEKGALITTRFAKGSAVSSVAFVDTPAADMVSYPS